MEILPALLEFRNVSYGSFSVNRDYSDFFGKITIQDMAGYIEAVTYSLTNERMPEEYTNRCNVLDESIWLYGSCKL